MSNLIGGVARTDSTVEVIRSARAEAQSFVHRYIGTEHIVLGIVSQKDTRAANILANMGSGVTLYHARKAVEFLIGRGEDPTLPFTGYTSRAHKVIGLAQDEARRRGLVYISPELLLMGLAREGEGIGAGVLESHGVNLIKLRTALEHELEAGLANSFLANDFSRLKALIVEIPLYEALMVEHERLPLLDTLETYLADDLAVWTMLQRDRTALGLAHEILQHSVITPFFIQNGVCPDETTIRLMAMGEIGPSPHMNVCPYCSMALGGWLLHMPARVSQNTYVSGWRELHLASLRDLAVSRLNQSRQARRTGKQPK